jgi:hypothetical protein
MLGLVEADAFLLHVQPGHAVVNLRVEVTKRALVLLAEPATLVRGVFVGLEHPIGRSLGGHSRVEGEGQRGGRGQTNDRVSELDVFHA